MTDDQHDDNAQILDRLSFDLDTGEFVTRTSSPASCSSSCTAATGALIRPALSASGWLLTGG